MFVSPFHFFIKTFQIKHGCTDPEALISVNRFQASKGTGSGPASRGLSFCTLILHVTRYVPQFPYLCSPADWWSKRRASLQNFRFGRSAWV